MVKRIQTINRITRFSLLGLVPQVDPDIDPDVDPDVDPDIDPDIDEGGEGIGV